MPCFILNEPNLNQHERDASPSCRNDFLTVSAPSAPRPRIYETVENVSVVCLSCSSCSQACWVTLTRVLTCSHQVTPTLKHGDDHQNRFKPVRSIIFGDVCSGGPHRRFCGRDTAGGPGHTTSGTSCVVGNYGDCPHGVAVTVASCQSDGHLQCRTHIMSGLTAQQLLVFNDDIPSGSGCCGSSSRPLEEVKTLRFPAAPEGVTLGPTDSHTSFFSLDSECVD